MKEEKLKKQFKHVIAIDASGIMSMAGPILFGAVEMSDNPISNIKPARKLLLEEKYEFFSMVWKEIKEFTVVEVSSKEIETYGIRNAIQIGIDKVISSLLSIKDYDLKETVFIIDFFKYENDKYNTISVNNGDLLCYSIACCSILVDVFQKQYMKRIHIEYPIFGWDANFGYEDETHIEGIKKYNKSVFHRNIERFTFS